MGDTFFYSLDGPLDAIPGARQMRTANLTGFGELVRRLGAEPRGILERHGIDPRTVRDPDAYIDSKSFVDTLQYCSTALGDPLFGVRLAQLQEPDIYGSVAALCRAASSVREALRGFVDYIPVVHSPVAKLELAEGAEVAELRWHVPVDIGLNDQANYQGTLLNLKLLRQVGGAAFKPSYVSLTCDTRPHVVAQFERELGCALRGRAAVNAIGFPVHLLEQPVASSNRLLFRLLGGYLERVRVASRKTIVEQVEDYVRGALPSGFCAIEHCARKLDTSVRSLQANLAEHDVRFSDVVERLRVDLAKTYLEQEGLSLDDVAARLGYSEQSSFGRAFKRWTGTTPQCYRRKLEMAA